MRSRSPLADGGGGRLGARRRWLALYILCGAACAHAPPPRAPHSEVGLASYQGRGSEGRPTASGRPYRASEMSCAHPSQPFGALLEVVDLDTGRSVTVRVIDRGPFVEGRVVDLSLAAAKALGMLERGVARVRVTRVE